MSNDFFNLAGDLLAGTVSAKIAFGNSTEVVPIPRYAESHPQIPAPRDERLDQLLLVCTAMWQLIKEKTDLTEEDLVNRVAMLDAQDGTADGKITEKPQPCPKCKRIVCAKHERCLYCGFQLPVDNVFKTV